MNEQLNEDSMIGRLGRAFFNLLKLEEQIDILEDEGFKDLYRKNYSKKREITLQDIYQKVIQQLYSNKENNFEYIYVYDFVQSSSGSSVIFSDYGKLYRADYNVISEDDVEITRIQKVKITYTDVDRKMRIYRSADNKLKFLAIAASTVLNRVGQIDSRDLFDDFEERFNDDVYLTFHHYKDENFKFGSVEGVFRLNNLLIAYGVIDETTTLGKYAERAFSNGEWGLSVGFQPLAHPELVDIGGVEIPTYREGKLIEISVLKESDAASYMTTIGSIDREFKIMGLDEKRAKEKLLEFTGEEGEDEIEALLKDSEIRERTIEDDKMITRDAEDATEEVDEVEEDITKNEEETTEDVIEFNIDEVVVQKITDAATERVAAIIVEKFSRFDEIMETLSEKVRSIESKMDNIQRSVENNTQRLTSVERSEDKKVQEAVEDLPTATKRQVNVSYRPLAEAKEHNVTKMTLQEIAHATLDNQ